MKLSWKNPPTEQARAKRDISNALMFLRDSPEERRLDALRALIKALRPPAPEESKVADIKLRALEEVVTTDRDLSVALRGALLWLLAEKQMLRLLSDSGILTSETFYGGLWRRIAQRLLPDVIDPRQLKDVIGMLFDRHGDYQWVCAIADERWVALLDSLDFSSLPLDAANQRTRLQTLDALQVVSFRIAAIGLEPELVRNYPDIEKYESPFLAQSDELREFISQARLDVADRKQPAEDDRHLQVLLEQCREITAKIRRHAEQAGASVSLTALLLRAEQNMTRMGLLLHQLQRRPAHEQNVERVRLFKTLVRAENRRNSLKEHWSQNLQIVSQRIASNAGRAGEQYIAASRREYFSLLRSAAGAGGLVALMAAAKLWLGREPHAPFVEAFLYSANYVAGFVLMYLWHLTLATKQPAMTANRIAHSMDRDERGRRSLDGLAELIVRTLRSQFIAVIGNLSVAVPLALLLGGLAVQFQGGPAIAPEKAAHLYSDLNPFSVRTWFYGALTGVWLFLSGLVSGYYDNRAAYDRIPQRLTQLSWLRRSLGEARAQRLAGYVEEHLGGLAGSVVFGLLLGSTAALGKVLGLPLDTLHVTFASANGVLAWAAGGHHAVALASALGGVLVIGALNLGVSFGLALSVALKAQQVEFNESGTLLRLLLARLKSRPLEYLWPTQSAEPAPPSTPPRV